LEVYEGCAAYFVTFAVSQRRPAFKVREIVEQCLSVLRSFADEQHMQVLAYCFMPDHVHLLLTAGEKANLSSFMRTFKQRTGYHCRKLLGWDGPFWQKSYYDHVLRREERLEAVAAYIWANPARAGLVEDADDYPFAGSLVAGIRPASAKWEDVEG
jgi:putative transposase